MKDSKMAPSPVPEEAERGESSEVCSPLRAVSGAGAVRSGSCGPSRRRSLGTELSDTLPVLTKEQLMGRVSG